MVLSKIAQTNLLKCKDILLKMRNQYPILKKYTLQVTRRKGFLGVTRFITKKIFIGHSLLDLGAWKQIEDTLYHEIAHAIDLNTGNFYKKRGGYHGITWQNIAKKFGIKGSCYGIIYDYSSFKPADYSHKKYLRFLNNQIIL